ncbi:MAG: hypothetical protein WCK55_10435 [Verrucomicrobiota bacterium]
MTQPANVQEPPEFSLVLGGPLFQLCRKIRLSGAAQEGIGRRIAAVALFAWLPLLILSAVGGNALGGGLKIPFLHDIEAHVRFLFVLPVLIVAEVTIDSRLRGVVRRFLEQGVVAPEDRAKFEKAVASVARVRDSVAFEMVLLVLVYSLGLWVWRSQVALGAATWYATPQGADLHLTASGWWYAFISIPFFQFIQLRWYARIFVWFRFLWSVSRLNLRIAPSHPDRAGGLGFVGRSAHAFMPILLAQGAHFSALLASQILFNGQHLLSYKMEITAIVAFFVLLFLGPLCMFSMQLSAAKRNGLREFGLLANRYVCDFEDKWLRGCAPKGEALVGTADIQSLADLGNSYAIVQEMRVTPFRSKDAVQLAIVIAAPVAPLLLTMIPLEAMVDYLLKTIF